MKLYFGSTSQFVEDVQGNSITDRLKTAFENYYGRHPGVGEVNSWTNSLQFVKNLIERNSLFDNGIIVEHELPYTNERIDCMLFGKSANSEDNVVVMELKQWSKVSDCEIDGNVTTFVGGTERMVPHPSLQVKGYHYLLKDFVSIFEEKPPSDLSSCVYCHNYKRINNDILLHPKFNEVTKEFPVFTKEDFERLGDYLKKRLANGKGLELLNRFSTSKIRPSKKLLEHTKRIIQGEPVFSLIDEQITANNTILDRAKKSSKLKTKSIIIVRGGPGTGKSVIALNVLANLLSKGLTVFHATGSAAFTTTIRKIVGTRAAAHFKYFNSFINTKENSIDVLICDEAHRIRKSSNSRYTRRDQRSDLSQIEELIRVAKVSIFFIDDYQVVRPDEIGSTKMIKEMAVKFGSEIFDFELKTQFRCSGSDGYLNWIDDVFGIRETENHFLTETDKMEFKIFDSPKALHNAIKHKNSEKQNSARLVAGFCWPWSDANPDGTLKEDVIISDFRMTWEAKNDARKLAPGIPKAALWAHDPNGVNQVGSIYTIQGFEFDYIGVIFGPDLKYNPKTLSWEGYPENSADKTVKRSKQQFADLVKNTYRVLLTRGMKGCFVYFMDKNTEEFFKSRILKSAGKIQDTISFSEEKLDAFLKELFSDEEVNDGEKFKSYLPVFSLQAAASGFSNGQYVEPLGWKRISGSIKLSKDMFIAKVVGKSMEPTIRDGSYCIFRREKGGTRDGLIVLVESNRILDSENGQRYTIKRYHSEKEFFADGTWCHKKITLSPSNKQFQDIVLKDIRPGDFHVVAEFVRALELD